MRSLCLLNFLFLFACGGAPATDSLADLEATHPCDDVLLPHGLDGAMLAGPRRDVEERRHQSLRIALKERPIYHPLRAELLHRLAESTLALERDDTLRLFCSGSENVVIDHTESVSLFRQLLETYQLYERNDDARQRLAWLEQGGF